MFENCGSCFAAEQFVDIKLGSKYLLTLTSFYNIITKPSAVKHAKGTKKLLLTDNKKGPDNLYLYKYQGQSLRLDTYHAEA